MIRVEPQACKAGQSSGFMSETPIPDRTPLVLVIEDGYKVSSALQVLCDFLEIAVERVSSYENLAPLLDDHRPIAVVARLEGKGQDGCHVMMMVAKYDRAIPVLLLTGDDTALDGAAEAVQQICGLETLVTCRGMPSVTMAVDFLFQAGRVARCASFMPV